MERILILGASGFIGYTLYSELCPYYNTYGTFYTNTSYRNNHHFINFNIENDQINALLHHTKPSYIISALRGDFNAQIALHLQLANYIAQKRCKVIFLSSTNVFDAFTNYPSYEYEKTLSESIYGKLKIKIENTFLNLPEKKYIIARLPMVFGHNSPRIKELITIAAAHKTYDIFPNLIMNTTYANKLAQQIHYIINRKRKGIFHLGSNNLIHHDEFIKEIKKKLLFKNLTLKNVYTSNADRYLAVLPRSNMLPLHLGLSNEDVIADSCRINTIG